MARLDAFHIGTALIPATLLQSAGVILIKHAANQLERAESLEKQVV